MNKLAVLGTVLSVALAGDAYAQQMIGGCPVLPANNIWNTPVDTLPVLSNSTTMVNTIGASRGFHADFGSGTWEGGPIGIPFITVRGSQAKFPATFLYSSESDRGPYAVPLNAPIEGGSNGTGDRHTLALDTDNCILYELYRAFPQSSSWTADSGAIFDLRSNALRPLTWTSGDAAGLPILPGLVNYDEILTGEIKHAIRFTVPQTRREYVWPARHYASSLTGTQYPRMGERFRLKANFDISGFPADVQIILRAMKKYGIILADNGSAWYISGKPDSRWNNNNLRTLQQLTGSNFEAVDATVLRIDPNSGAATQSGINVSVAPTSASVRVSQAQNFTATVTGASGGVTWSVNDIPGGNAIVGVIDTTGRYMAPSVVPSPNVVTVRAASTASPTRSGTASVTILAAATAPAATITSVTPSSFQAGTATLTVNGTGFAAGSTILFDGAPQTTTFVSATRLTAVVNAPTARASVPVSVMAASGTMSNTVLVTVTAAPTPATPTITSVTPTAFPVGNAVLTVNGTGFVAGSVVWFDGSARSTTFVSSTRLTAAVSAAAAKSSVPVVVRTPSNVASNTVTVNVTATTPPPASAVRITISPTTATVRTWLVKRFTATVQGTTNTDVIWKVNGVVGGNRTVGTISSGGIYAAPSSVPSPAVVTVTATSSADQTKVASATVTIQRW